jgi:ribosomal protein S10
MPKLNKKSHLMTLSFTNSINQDLSHSLSLTNEFSARLCRWLIARSHFLKKERFFLELALSISSSMPKQVSFSKSKPRFTMTRSPFIFKKTREQFELRRQTRMILLKLNKSQQELILEFLCQSRFPAELKITTY